MTRTFQALLFVSISLLYACGGGSSETSETPAANTGSSGSSSSSSSTSSSGTLFPDYNTNPVAPDMTGMSSTAQQIAAQMTLGWNIGNTLEATGSETSWGNPKVTPELIQTVKANGFDAIRIPAAWNQYADPVTAEIDPAWLARVKEVVQYCIDEDMPVLLNIHWDGGWLEENISRDKQAQNNAKQKAFWQQIATYLRDFDERLIFASANEPNVDDEEQMTVLMAYHQTFIDAVRATGGKNAYRILVVQGPRTDIEKTNHLWAQMPVDTLPDRLMLEVHFYTPFNFAGLTKDESWGNQFYYWGEGNRSSTDTTRNPTWGEEDEVDRLLALMKTQFIDEGIPVVIGEYGAIRRENLSGEQLELHRKSRKYYLQYVTQQSRKHGLIPFYWDNGALGNFGYGIFDRRNYSVFDQQALDAVTGTK